MVWSQEDVRLCQEGVRWWQEGPRRVPDGVRKGHMVSQMCHVMSDEVRNVPGGVRKVWELSYGVSKVEKGVIWI